MRDISAVKADIEKLRQELNQIERAALDRAEWEKQMDAHAKEVVFALATELVKSEAFTSHYDRRVDHFRYDERIDSYDIGFASNRFGEVRVRIG